MDKLLKEIINKNTKNLENSCKDFKSIYEVSFSAGDMILAETDDGFRIKKHTYREVFERVEKTAAALYKKLGSTEAIIGLEMENCVEWIVAFWAILRSGNRPYLINCRHPKELSNGIIKTLKINHIVALDKGNLSAEYILFSELEGIDAPAVPSDVFGNEIALSTSATTMNEVVCFYNGANIAEQVLNSQNILNECPQMAKHVDGSLKQLAFLPFYHIFGLAAVYFWFTFFGRTLVFLKDYSSDTILKTCRKHKVTHIFAVPMLWHTVEKQLLKEVKAKGERAEKKFWRGIKLCTRLQNIFPNLGQRLSMYIMREVTDNLFGNSVRFLISGGSYIKTSTLELLNGLGYPIHNGFGMTEVGITSVELRNRPKYRNLGSIGKPFDSIEYKITENKTLSVKGGSICSRMIINGTQKPTDEWFNTGDIMEETNGYYFIKGRMSDLVIGENGENINPDVIEQHFKIQDADQLSVLGLGENDKAELSLVIRVNDYLPIKRLNKIIEAVYNTNETLPATNQVKKFYFTYEPLAPETAVKVSRKLLVKMIDSGKVKLIPFADIKENAPMADDFDEQSAVALKVKQIIAAELDVEPVKITATTHIIFDLGASSLQYFSILTKLSKEFSITNYSDSDTYSYTLKDFCKYIEEHI